MERNSRKRVSWHGVSLLPAVPHLVRSAENMNLIETLNLINAKDDFDPIMTVYAQRPWALSSEAIIVPQPEDGSIAPIDGHNYFLEVFIIKDWLVDLDCREVSEDTVNRIIQYATNDA